jgi:hypothetical protein
MSQKILTLLTSNQDIRSRVEGWGGEDSSLLVLGKPIGLTPGASYPLYETVLHAMHDGWRLMGPPVPGKFGSTDIWDWWLEKSC